MTDVIGGHVFSFLIPVLKGIESRNFGDILKFLHAAPWPYVV
jgi:hypothetical protein